MLWRLRTSWLSCQSSGTCEHCPGSWPMKWPRLRGCSTFDAQWPKGQEGSILQLNVRSAGALRTHIFPQLWPMASYASCLWSSETGIQVPILLWMRCSLETCFLTRLPPPTAVWESEPCALTLDCSVLFLLLPWTPLGHLYLPHHCLWWDS